MSPLLGKDGKLAITDEKLQLLNTLLSRQGEFVSGQEIAEKMGLSRPSVWKDIQYFKALNYRIEARSKVGYRLIGVPDILHPLQYFPFLNTRRYGRTCYYHRVIDSTNREARRLIERGVPDGTIVIAEYQSKGMGRWGRKWFSPFGKNIILSLILYPSLEATSASLLPFLTGVKLAQALEEETGVHPSMLWPNDVLFARRKIAGILVESAFRQSDLEHVIIGVGVNVNSSLVDFPGGLQERVTTLREILGRPTSRQKLLAVFLEKMENGVRAMEEGKASDTLEQWRFYADFLGDPVRILLGDSREVRGTARDVLPDGRLLLHTDSGDLPVDASEVISLSLK